MCVLKKQKGKKEEKRRLVRKASGLPDKQELNCFTLNYIAAGVTLVR